jgi:tryptophan 2,3-dioxygenase
VHPSEDVTYGDYLAVSELLRLQRPRSHPEHPDELLFIVVHQASELWFKVLLHEFDLLATRLERREAMAALATMRRIHALTRIVAAQLSALDTLPPQRFAEFRGYLGTASGGQSVQFRAIEAASGLRDDHFMAVLHEHGEIPAAVQRVLARPTLQALYLDLVAERGTTLEQVYADPAVSDLFLLAESLIEYEQGFGLWRFLHVQMVERIIGPQTGGTGGTLGSKYLQRTLSQRFFPKLWEVRAKFFGAGASPVGPSGS